ncbi:hypothetical protein AJ79_01557 [Helicocarpus griseus UAMH5409]|uniref:RING-type domain-containing protein n=1 Tax=Helicocarpus griseus UAMH5409 TaxID=1447875 RepID=A0A2B7Y661_9EURO|nr:hypothetical protein AJ79_01557 [Helicocarpus griseus UAMH5409]
MHILPSSLAELILRALLSLCACTLLSTTVQAQVSRPSNDTSDLLLPRPGPNFKLRTRQFSMPPVTLAPLTVPLKRMFQNGDREDFRVSGRLVTVDANNASSVTARQIAFISCDDSAYSGNLKVNDTLKSALTGSTRPAAVIIFSTEYEHCNYSSDGIFGPVYPNVFTVTDPEVARNILAALSGQQFETATSDIMPDIAVVREDMAVDEGTQRNNVAMIILYSITGIITALFLSVIITGAIRAHLNPDRYGPRNAIGRPRQSRAKGIARAMLETIPIIKFGDSEDGKAPPAKTDVELASNDGDAEHDRVRSDRTTQTAGGGVKPPETQQQEQQQTDRSTAPAMSQVQESKGQQDDGVIGPAASEPKAVNPEQPSEAGTLGCPICTDDFIKGQDVRLLPCQHKFHPECVDPWLINVSGTCPLCRINLNPAEPDEDLAASTSPTAVSNPLPPPLRDAHDSDQPSHTTTRRHSTTTPRRHRGLSAYFIPSSIHGNDSNILSNRDATMEERLATLRQLRSAHQANMTATGAIEPSASSAADELSRRNRLTARLRDRFRVLTRQHEGGAAAAALRRASSSNAAGRTRAAESAGTNADASANSDANADAGGGAASRDGNGETTQQTTTSTEPR